MEKFSKVVKVLVNTLTTIIIIIGIIVALLYASGIEPFVVQSGSMESCIETGSLSFINKRANYEDIKQGDVIGYVSATNKKVLHRIVRMEDEGVYTKGDANKSIDGTLVTNQNYVGKAVFWIPKLGYVVSALQSKRGRVLLITVILAMGASAFLLEDSSKDEKRKNEKMKKNKGYIIKYNGGSKHNSENNKNDSICDNKVGNVDIVKNSEEGVEQV
ncbi:MAG: signal peptidase I [Clostridia bacterium]|nr:signal peptidase I [Clostridia bacterium]